MADDLTDTIKQNAEGPAEAHGDGVGVKQHSLPDQIAADKHVLNKDAASRPSRSLRKVKIISPGSV